ncbi:succinate dehydrogenase, hydrophobic membrane anchor protein [Niveibacterium umoris]|uniref:Succinate dehydrogenase hydrophobic membrane anchor subunit n=1 Tax=Niveibacterium umoris TaxID=1193620 RepID=A0A840BIG2_9RHOO|nr:succinate dehydrogenase, hydrophobic membrane anchor protein [Niveibacterium umoris]MBB4011362.1 succinate dehydrogenase / fumarate reductase membrane anchor subunit [Niveibacterium umoris]
MQKRIVVGAHYGLRDWIAQRVTATVMALYSVFFVINLLCLPAFTSDAWRAMFAGGFMRFATFLFWLSLFFHAWVGVRDIFMDYVKPVGVRLALHSVVALLLIGYAGWAAQILWRL